MNFLGYTREDGRVGVRNHTLIMPLSHLANHAAFQISKSVPGTVYFKHQHGTNQRGEDLVQTRKVLNGFATHPNVFGVVIIGVGNELVHLQEVLDESTKAGKFAYGLNIRELGGLRNTIQKGIEYASLVEKQSQLVRRTEVPLSELILGTECGGSDAFSGIAANPAVGKCSDLLIENGGISILSETMEIVGAEHLLAARAINDKVRKQLLSAIKHTETEAMKMGVDIRGTQPARGNIEGGITTIEEKSLGCLNKGGTTDLVEVIRYADKPTNKGLVFMDTPGQDIEQLTGMIAGGCQIAAFTTGRGTPVGSPIAPVIKIASNDIMYQKMKFNMDLNAGEIVNGNKTINEVGEELFELLIQVASGKLTRSEELKHNEFGIFRIGRSI